MLTMFGVGSVGATDSTNCSPTASTSHFDIEFLGVTYNAGGTSTWDYTVTWDGYGSDLDKFVLKLCHSADVVSSSPAGASVGYFNSVGMYGIRWHTDLAPNVPTSFSVTLDKPYLTSKTVVALKASYYPHYRYICGPSKFCTQALLPPQNLVCDLDDCTGETLVTWDNVSSYDFVNVRVDGVLVATLPGDTTSTTVTVGSGVHSIELTGVIDDDDDDDYDHHSSSYSSDDDDDDDDDDHDDDDDDHDDDDDDDDDEDQETDPTKCFVDRMDVNPVPPSNLFCTPDLLDCSVMVGWVNTRDYAEIVVSVDGVPVQTLPGNVTGITLPGPLVGTHTVCLNGTSTCGTAFPEVCCTFSCDDPAPPPVTDLLCMIDDVCTCTASISWTNGAGDYDTLDIFVDGAFTATVPGSTTMTTVDLGDAGAHSVCVVPSRNGFTGDQTCCSITCDEVPNGAPMALNCDAPPAPDCVASASWLNSGNYASIDVYLDGVFVETLPGSATSADVSIPDSGTHTLCIRATTICGEVLPDVCCTVDCIGPPDPITDLNCALVDICTCEFNVTWTNNNSDYDEIQVLIDGVLHEQLPGNVTRITLFLESPTPLDVCLVPVRAGLSAPPVCCTTDCQGVPAAMVEDLTCDPDPLSCEFTLGWTNPVPYNSIEVTLDGIVIATLPGTATEYVYATPLTGLHEFCVTGTTICDEVAPATCCSVDCTIPPPNPVFDLVCGAVDPCTCTLAIAWTNSEANYDSIDILIEGVLFTTLPGNAMNAAITLPGAGSHAICVIPNRNGVSGMMTCCKADCPVTDPIPPTVLECVVDDATCTATINWQNNALYSQIEVTLAVGAGAPVVIDTVAGDAMSYSVVLTTPGQHTLAISATTACGVITGSVSCKVSCPELTPPPISNLNCMLTDVCTCTATTTWVNGGVYDAILLFIDGVETQTLPGNAETVTYSVGAPGMHEVCIVPVINGVNGGPECCMVDCPDVPLLAPNGLSCTVGASPDCLTSLSWINHSDYSQIVVLLDGVPVETLAGTATSATLNLPGAGLQTICLEATTICNDVLPEVCCDVECIFPPDPIMNLVCPIDTDPCSGTLTWTNTNADYDSIVVTLDGVLFATLPGDATMVPYGPLASGPHEFCITAVRNGLDSTVVCCTVECPVPPDAPLNVTCTLDDFCLCTGTVSWMNAEGDYDAIEVTVDGVVVATLPGNATSAPVTLPAPGSSNVCVTAVRNALSSPPACCTLDCAGPPPSTAPIGLVCATGPSPACETTVNWQNTSDYSQIVVTVGGVMVATLPGTATSTTLSLAGPGPQEICLIATTTCNDVLPPVCCTSECIFPPDAPLNVTCTLDDFCLCTGTVSWDNANADYDAIEVRVDGVLVATLAGNATSAPVTLPAPGASNICVTAVRNGLSSPEACCTLDCSGPVPLLPPSGLTLDIGGRPNCETTLTWVNNSDYSQIVLTINGAVVLTLPGDATSALINLTDSGMQEVCLVATTVCNDVLAPVCIQGECLFPPPLPSVPTCTLDDVCTCAGTLTWVNNSATYESILVKIGGVVVETLPGDATMANVVLPGPGSTLVCIEAIENGLSSGDACCTLDCAGPPLPIAPASLVCNVTDPATCTVDLTWTNSMPYTSIQVLSGTTVLADLAGTDTSATVMLDGGTEICLVATTECGNLTDPVCCAVECATPFQRGDCNVDDLVNIADGIYIMRFLFQGFPPSTCFDACDHNGDGSVDVSDAIFVLTYIFMGGTPPPAPFDECGVDGDSLPGCTSYPPCAP